MKKVALRRLPFRQIHLDFHTHGDIPNVGAAFDRRRFQQALREARADSVTLFAKCHHGWSYHPTKVGRTHPTLRRDLLGEQIEACREIGVRCPIYLSAGFDELAASLHPEWVAVNELGSARAPLEAGWRWMRFNSPYLDYLCAQIAEVVDRWSDCDGLFLDIVAPRHDFSEANLRAMRARRLDPRDPEDRERWAQLVLLEYYRRPMLRHVLAAPICPSSTTGGTCRWARGALTC